jgi:hypothetical protein
VEFEPENGSVRIVKTSGYRTAHLLMEGKTYG